MKVMPMLDTLLGLAGVGTTIANVSLVRRFLSGIALVVALTAAGGVMTGIFMAAMLYALYLSLVRHGLDPVIAAVMIGGFALVIIALLGTFAAMRWYQLREIPNLLYPEKPFFARAGKIADAFMNGFIGDRSQRP